MPDETATHLAIADLVTANHILFDRGILDAFGHVSVRHPEGPDKFLLSRNSAPALVTHSDVMTFDFDGNALDHTENSVYLERFIHGEIYRLRPDVQAVVHSHAQSILPFTVVRGLELCPVCHMSGFIKPRTPVFEIRRHAGDDSDLLIRSSLLGRHLAQALGTHPIILMRGHGMTVVGANLHQAVFRAVYVEANARIQTAAMGLGSVTFLNEMEAEAADAANSGQVERAWALWRRSAANRVAVLSQP